MDTKEKIIGLLQSTNRKGMDSMIKYMVDEGFFEAPASTKFRGCYDGALAEHSLRVYELLDGYAMNILLNDSLSPGQNPLKIEPASLIIAPLLHDICKIGAYIPTPDGKNKYRWNKQQPRGHALLSIERIKKYIELEPIEEMMIKYHMGIYGLFEFYEKDSWEYKTNAEYPIRGDHSNDENMTKEESKAARYGKSLRNCWYHNPIVKLMYFCDEIATLEEKAE